MLIRKDSIEALLTKSKQQLEDIIREYQLSLNKQNISDILKVDIKNYCENIRSILDYLAHEIHDKYCSASTRTNYYFPILPDNRQFAARMSQWYPSLNSSNNAIYSYLETIQPYNPQCAWLGEFNKINNENKHGDLVEQTKTQSERITAKSNSGKSSVSWSPQNVQFGSGVYINGVHVNPKTQIPEPSPNQTVMKVIWVDFIFAEINRSAISLLKKTYNGVSKIYEDLENII